MICPAAPTCPHVRNHKGKPKKAKCGYWWIWTTCPHRESAADEPQED